MYPVLIAHLSLLNRQKFSKLKDNFNFLTKADCKICCTFDIKRLVASVRAYYRMDAINDFSAVTVSLEFVFYSVIIVVNLLIFCTIMKMENTENYTFIIASLSLSDALVGLNQIIANILFLLNVEDVWCNFGSAFVRICLLIFGTLTSQWHTVVLSVDRYLAVQYALTYSSMVTPLRLKLMVLSAWVIGALITLLLAVIEYFQPPCIDNARISRIGFPVVMLSEYLATTIINAVIYVKLWLVARKHRNQITAFEGQVQRDTSSNSKKATVIVFLIVVVCGVLWFPYIISIFLTLFGKPSLSAAAESYQGVLSNIGCSNSLINSLIYVIMNKNIRMAMKQNMCKRN